LVVSGVSSSDGDYAADVASFNLAPGASRSVAVTFAPTRVGLIAATLTITSNDPDEPVVEVALRGAGAVPPAISVSPTSIADSLDTGATSTHELAIANTGGSGLTWSLRVVSSEGVAEEPNAELSDIQILWDLSHGQIPSSNWSVILGDLVSRGATVTESYLPITTERLAGYDVVWLTDMEDWGSIEVLALQSWLTDGGAMLIESDASYTAVNAVLSSLGGALLCLPAPGTPGSTSNIYPHQSTFGVTGVYLGGPDAQLYVAAPAGRLVDDAAGRPICAFAAVGSGRVFCASDEVFEDGVIGQEYNRRFGNQVVDWLTGESTWLSALPSQGDVPPGSEQVVTVTLDASALLPGEYGLIMEISSSDPVNPVVSVPVHLSVNSLTASGIDPENGDIPTSYALHPNYPNPFNPVTTIRYDLPKTARVSLVVYNVKGEKVRELVSRDQPQGRYEVLWDGRDIAGSPAASGVYFFKLVAGEFVETRKMVLLK